jgi:peptidoglycan hydrolase-like protein with peptidoglycan-binding domain
MPSLLLRSQDWYNRDLRPYKFLSALLAIAIFFALTGEAKTRRSSKGGSSKAKVTRTASSKSNSAKGKRTRGSATQTAWARQASPSTQRYMEIQQALADKGFYNGPINGEWGPESVEALKRFQESTNLKPDGKLGALSLIGLGLGPKHDYRVPDAAEVKGLQQE